MTNPEKVKSIINNLREFRRKLDTLARYSEKDLLNDFTKVESTKHLLQVSIQSCIDIAHHIVADEGFRVPNNAYDTLTVLRDEGILSDVIMPKMRQMISFRNRVVYLYWDIDEKMLYQILQERLNDFEAYIAQILAFLEKSGEQKNQVKGLIQ